MILAVMHLIADADDPGGIVSRLMNGVVPGSYLALSAATNDFDTDRVNQATGEFNSARVATQFTPRTHAEISRYFDGLDLLDPGLVPVARWRAPADLAQGLTWYAGVARKPA